MNVTNILQLSPILWALQLQSCLYFDWTCPLPRHLLFLRPLKLLMEVQIHLNSIPPSFYTSKLAQITVATVDIGAPSCISGGLRHLQVSIWLAVRSNNVYRIHYCKNHRCSFSSFRFAHVKCHWGRVGLHDGSRTCWLQHLCNILQSGYVMQQ